MHMIRLKMRQIFLNIEINQLRVNVLEQERIRAIERLAHVKRMQQMEPSWVEEDEIKFLCKKIEQITQALEILRSKFK